MGVTEELCRAVTETTFSSLPGAAMDAAKQLIIDGLAISIAGVHESGPQILAEHVRQLGGTEHATAFGFGFKTSSVFAAYLNGTSMHVLDYEPMWSPPNHAVSTTLPALLALSECRPASGRDVITALVKGCEVQGLLRVASGHYEPRNLKYHPPGLVGVMGAAAAASHLLGLDAARLANAFGIAGSRSGSLLANVGTMTKATHCGLAAAMGLDAALLAERGFTGNSEIFEAANGYAEVFGGGDFDLNALARFGEPFRIIEPGYTIKLFPCQFATQYGITAALDVRSRISNSSEIASVRIVTPVMPYVDRPHPRTGLDGKFSFQFTTACALLDGAVTTESFTDDRRFRADMERLLGRIELVQSSDIPGNLEQMYVDVSVKLAGGATESSRCDGLRGSWGRPPLSPKEHFGKVHDCLAAHLSEEEIESCTAHIGQLEVLPPEKVRILIEMFM